MTIVGSSFYGMMMHRWALLLEDSLRGKEKMYGRGVGVVVARVVNDFNIQYRGRWWKALLLSLFIIIFPLYPGRAVCL